METPQTTHFLIEYFKSPNGLGLMLNLILGAIVAYFAQKQKWKIDKAIEQYKTALQMEFIKSEMKAKQLFSIYPEVFSKLQNAESTIYQLKGAIQRLRPVTAIDIKEAENILILANNSTVHNALFLSNTVYEFALELISIMGKCLYSEDDKEAIEFSLIMSKKIEKLKKQMQKELEAESHK